MKYLQHLVLAFLVVSFAASQTRAQPAGASKPSQWNVPGEPPFVVAHYVDWFSLDTRVAGKSWDHWSRDGEHGHDATKWLPNGLRDVASIVYPLIGTYDSTQADVVRYHLATMKAAGISGIIIDWYGQGCSEDIAVKTILDEADKLGMKVALCYEEKVPADWSKPKTRQDMLNTAVRDLTYAINTWTTYPAYLKRNGEPFVMQFNGWGEGPIGPMYLKPDEDRVLFDRLPQKLAYCRQNMDASFHPIVPGAYIWWQESDRPKSFAAEAAALRDQGRLEFFMSMLGVGFNDTGVWGWGPGPRVSKDYGVSVLARTESMATLDGPELIQCVTWNDFNEGTPFEPTVQYGFSFVDEVEKFIGKLHGRPVNLEDNREPYEQYRRTCTEQQRKEIPPVEADRLQPNSR